jgi:hypothetical protein
VTEPFGQCNFSWLLALICRAGMTGGGNDRAI